MEEHRCPAISRNETVSQNNFVDNCHTQLAGGDAEVCVTSLSRPVGEIQAALVHRPPAIGKQRAKVVTGDAWHESRQAREQVTEIR